MDANNRLASLRGALMVIEAIFIIGAYPLTILLPSGWTWHVGGPSMYLEMILGLYATLGVFLLRAAGAPLKNLSLIWFTVWSSIVHGGKHGPLHDRDAPHRP